MDVRATGPQVHEALKSPLDAEWVNPIDTDIDMVIEKFKCLQEEEIDTSRPYDLVHATM